MLPSGLGVLEVVFCGVGYCSVCGQGVCECNVGGLRPSSCLRPSLSPCVVSNTVVDVVDSTCARDDPADGGYVVDQSCNTFPVHPSSSSVPLVEAFVEGVGERRGGSGMCGVGECVGDVRGLRSSPSRRLLTRSPSEASAAAVDDDDIVAIRETVRERSSYKSILLDSAHDILGVLPFLWIMRVVVCQVRKPSVLHVSTNVWFACNEVRRSIY